MNNARPANQNTDILPQLRRMWEKIGIFTKFIVLFMWVVFAIQ
jgi:hypothetical protein